jgi:hypothetical protein
VRRSSVEKIEHSRIVIANCAGPMVAQIAVEPNISIPIVSLDIVVDNIQVLPCMCVKQSQVVAAIRNA